VSEPPVEHLRDPMYKTEGDYEGMLRILNFLFSYFFFPPPYKLLSATSQDELVECALKITIHN